MSEQTVQIADDLIWRETDDGVVVVDPSQGLVRVLNGVGSSIWKSASTNSQSVGKITQEIVEEYAVSQEQASQDVQAFLSQLVESGLIVITA